MENHIPEIAVATRTFGNSKMHEGVRVKAGTRFAVEKPNGDLKVITAARYKQLFFARLVRPFGEADVAAAPRPIEQGAGEQIEANKIAEAVKPITTETIKRPSQRAAAVREAAVRRTQDPEPPAPKRLENPAQGAPPGSPSGGPQSASSSPADHPSNSSSPTSRPRGRRRA